MTTEGGDITQLLRAARAGDESASRVVWERLHGDLRAIASSIMGRQRGTHTLTPTAVVHEAYIRLFGGSAPDATDRQHFVALAAKAMRALLVDHARRKGASKRGGDWTRVRLEEPSLESSPIREPRVLDLHRALNRLADHDQDLARLVELRYFGGLTLQEVAEVMGIGVTVVKENWSFARAWLSRDMRREGTAESD